MIQEKIKRAFEIADDRGTHTIADFVLHLQIHKTRGAASRYQLSMQKWMDKGGLLVFEVVGQKARAVFMSDSTLRQCYAGIESFVCMWNAAADEEQSFWAAYIAYFAVTIMGSQSWVPAMRRRVILHGSHAGTPSAARVYEALAAAGAEPSWPGPCPRTGPSG